MSALTPAQRFRIAADMHETGKRMYKQKLRRKFPQASDEELRKMFVDWLMGNSPIDLRRASSGRRANESS